MEKEEKIKAIMNRDSSYDGKFYYGVKSTGIVCKPSCKAKNPHEKNIVLFDTFEQAIDAGFRPCKICMKPLNVIQIQRYHSPCGDLILGSFQGKLCLCDWAVEKHRDVVDIRLRKVLKASYEEKTSDIIQETSRQLDEYFDSKRTVFDIPLLFVGTEFQKKVWHKLLEIPYGKTISYGELAKQLNIPKAVRAVANANGANAISIIAPCHRVIGSDHSLTGYGGGLTAKKMLLDLELNLNKTFKE